MTTNTQTTFHTGDRVRVDDPKFPGIWIVRSTAGTVNAKLDNANGGRGLRAPYSMLIAATGDDGTETSAASMFQPFRPRLEQGTLVRVDSAKINGGNPSQLFVVVTDKIERVNIVKLGGDNGRYWRASPTTLHVVDVAEVIK